MNNLNEVLGKMTEFLKTEAKTETIIGEQFKLGEYTCVPIMHIGLGFGGGGGDRVPPELAPAVAQGKGGAKDKGEGQGFGAAGAAGMGMGPVGFLVTRNNEIQFIPTHTSKGLGAALEKLPELMDKYLDQNKKKSKTRETVET